MTCTKRVLSPAAFSDPEHPATSPPTTPQTATAATRRRPRRDDEARASMTQPPERGVARRNGHNSLTCCVATASRRKRRSAASTPSAFRRSLIRRERPSDLGTTYSGRIRMSSTVKRSTSHPAWTRAFCRPVGHAGSASGGHRPTATLRPVESRMSATEVAVAARSQATMRNSTWPELGCCRHRSAQAPVRRDGSERRCSTGRSGASDQPAPKRRPVHDDDAPPGEDPLRDPAQYEPES